MGHMCLGHMPYGTYVRFGIVYPISDNMSLFCFSYGGHILRLRDIIKIPGIFPENVIRINDY